MNKITPEHLAREAYVYVRQSTADQLLNNPESRRRQYALVARARALGWENSIVIDDDLGRSGDGQVRPASSVCSRRSPPARPVRCWRSRRRGWPERPRLAQLLEFCAFVNSLIIDEDGRRSATGQRPAVTWFERNLQRTELSIFRQRSQEALRLKAARGELYTTVAIGYGAALMIVSNRTPTAGSVKRCLWYSASSAKLAACASSPVAAPGGD